MIRPGLSIQKAKTEAMGNKRKECKQTPRMLGERRGDRGYYTPECHRSAAIDRGDGGESM